jgi:hypothetical protein
MPALLEGLKKGDPPSAARPALGAIGQAQPVAEFFDTDLSQFELEALPAASAPSQGLSLPPSGRLFIIDTNSYRGLVAEGSRAKTTRGPHSAIIVEQGGWSYALVKSAHPRKNPQRPATP